MDVVLAAPPCNTHSRALWANPNGPKPVRNLSYPRGFAWLSGSDKSRCELADLLVDRSLDVMEWATSIISNVLWLVEHPEDLGRTRKGDDPASLWQLKRVRDLHVGDVFTGAMYQCKFEAPTSKPTRWMDNITAFKRHLHLGWPVFDKHRAYQGPLPASCGHAQHAPLIGLNQQGLFATSKAAAYPPLLCKA